MLHAGRPVVVEVLLDLALAPPVGGLVDGQHDLVVVPHDGRHQRRVLGGDLVVVEVDEGVEAEHLVVVVDPLVEVALLDVAHDVVEAGEADLGARGGRELRRPEPGGELAGVAAAVEERVHRLAVGADGGVVDGAELVGVDGGRALGQRAAVERGGVRRLGVVDEEADVAHAVPVGAHVLGDRRVGRQRAGDHEADAPLLQHVRHTVAPAGLGPRVGHDLEPERRHQEPAEGSGVADPPFDVVDPPERGRCGPAGPAVAASSSSRPCFPSFVAVLENDSTSKGSGAISVNPSVTHWAVWPLSAHMW